MTQLGLTFDAPAPARRAKRRAPTRKAPIAERFAEFHAANPHIFVELMGAAMAARACDETRLSIAKLIEELRADPEVRTVGGGFKIDNSFRAPYARLLMEREPYLAGCFETRGKR